MACEDVLPKTEEFRSWYDGCRGSESDNAVLFCYGDQGSVRPLSGSKDDP